MTPPNFKVEIVVLQYNNSSDTIKCLGSVAFLDYPSFRVIVVDNHSKEEHSYQIRKWLQNYPISNTEYLISDANMGYAGGNNFRDRFFPTCDKLRNHDFNSLGSNIYSDCCISGHWLNIIECKFRRYIFF